MRIIQSPADLIFTGAALAICDSTINVRLRLKPTASGFSIEWGWS